MSESARQQERQFQRELRDLLVDEIRRRGMSAEDVALAAGFFRTGVETLLERQHWPLEVGVRIADGLGMRIKPDAQPRS